MVGACRADPPGTGGAGPTALPRLLEQVRRIRVPGALNIYDESQSTAFGDRPGMAMARWRALGRYLGERWGAPTVLVGEAPGKDGARWTGVPFTSCRMLTGSGPTEPSATTVQRVLAELHCEDQVLLWNASVLFAPGNRDPRRAELEACAPVLRLVCEGRRVFAVGRHAELATGAPYLRHPAHGGARLFAEGAREVLRGGSGFGRTSARGVS
jgi:hypothetical protein